MDLNRILVPVDGSKKSFEALDRAITLAGFTHGQVTCIHVIPHVPEGVPEQKHLISNYKMTEKHCSKRQQNVQETKTSSLPQNYLGVPQAT